MYCSDPAEPSSLEFHDFSETYKAFAPRIRAVCSRYRAWPVQQDDLRQAAAMALWRSMDKYDASAGTPFEHYASRAIRRAVAEEADKERKHWVNRVVALSDDPDTNFEVDDVSHPDMCDAVDSERNVVFDAVLLQQINEWASTLSKPLRRVYELRHIAGLNQSEAARQMAISQQRVSTLEQKLAGLARTQSRPRSLQ
jgi:RNA polymerase sigma factor (sigma-70 family)